MKTIIDDFQVYFKSADRSPLKVDKTDVPSTFLLHFKSDLGKDLTVVSVAIQFTFNVEAFIQKYHELYPQQPMINEDFILSGIFLFYNHVESIIFRTDMQGYDEMAHLFMKKRGQIALHIFGV